MKRKPREVLDELLNDPKFEDYVKNPDADNNLFWETWLSNNPDMEKVFFLAKDMIRSANYDRNRPTWKQEEVYEKIESSISHLNKRISNRNKIFRYSGIAATISLVALLSILFFNNEPKYIEYQSFETIKEIELADGSQVTLNTNSVLKVPINLEKAAQREVILEGEAYFEVEDRPSEAGLIKFIVNTPEFQVEVLGTSFNVDCREKNNRVVLETGKVKLKPVSNSISEITLEPGEMALLEKNNQKFIKQDVSTKKYTAWKNQEIYLDYAPLADVVKILESLYGYKVTVADSVILKEKLIGTFPKNDSQILLETLRIIIEVEEKGQELVLKEKK